MEPSNHHRWEPFFGGKLGRKTRGQMETPIKLHNIIHLTFKFYGRKIQNSRIMRGT